MAGGVDLNARLAGLGETVARVSAEREVSGLDARAVAQEDRRRVWAEVQRDAPELAAFALEVRKFFPGSKIVRAVINGKRVI